MSQECLWKGWVEKQGIKVKNWKTRWMTLSADGKLRYYRVTQSGNKEPTNLPKPAGEIDLVPELKGIIEGDKCGVEWPKAIPEQSAFGLVTNTRVYYVALLSSINCKLLVSNLHTFRKKSGIVERQSASSRSLPERPDKQRLPLPEPSPGKQKPAPGEVFYESWHHGGETEEVQEIPTYAVVEKKDRKPARPPKTSSDVNKLMEQHSLNISQEQPQYANVELRRNRPPPNHTPGEVIYDPLVTIHDPESKPKEVPQYAVSDKLRKRERQKAKETPKPEPDLPLYENIELRP